MSEPEKIQVVVIRVHTEETPPAECPYCGKELGVLSGVSAPKAGDCAVCVGCAGIIEVGPDLRPIVASDEFLANLAAGPNWEYLQAMRQAVPIINKLNKWREVGDG